MPGMHPLSHRVAIVSSGKAIALICKVIFWGHPENPAQIGRSPENRIARMAQEPRSRMGMGLRQAPQNLRLIILRNL